MKANVDGGASIVENDAAFRSTFDIRHSTIAFMSIPTDRKYLKSHEWHKSSLVEVEGNRIVRYDEKAHSDSRLTAIMTGFARASIFEHIPTSDVKFSLQEDVFAALAAEGKLSAYMFNSTWLNL